MPTISEFKEEIPKFADLCAIKVQILNIATDLLGKNDLRSATELFEVAKWCQDIEVEHMQKLICNSDRWDDEKAEVPDVAKIEITPDENDVIQEIIKLHINSSTEYCDYCEEGDSYAEVLQWELEHLQSMLKKLPELPPQEPEEEVEAHG